MTTLEQRELIEARFREIQKEFPEIRIGDDSVLHSTAEVVTIEEGVQIGQQLKATLKRYREFVGYGRGLAGPQIGLNKAVFVTFIEDKFMTFINPKILEISSTTNFLWERCLSSGALDADVERPEWVIMQWLDEEGKQHVQKFDGFLARIYQHEIDHLNGMLNTERAVGHTELAYRNPLEQQLRTSR